LKQKKKGPYRRGGPCVLWGGVKGTGKRKTDRARNGLAMMVGKLRESCVKTLRSEPHPEEIKRFQGRQKKKNKPQEGQQGRARSLEYSQKKASEKEETRELSYHPLGELPAKRIGREREGKL